MSTIEQTTAVAAPAGTRVLVTTTNGARVEGVLLRDADTTYGSGYPSVKTDEGWTFDFAHSMSIAPSGAEFSPIAPFQGMEVIS